MSTTTDTPAPTRRMYVPAVGPRLRILLTIVFILTALLGANSIYLLAIKAMSFVTGQTYENYFYLLMFMAHLVLGLLLIGPLVAFGFIHMFMARGRKNRRAVRVGYALFAASLGVLITGLLLVRVGNFDLRNPMARGIVYWAHVALPCSAVWLYWLHRLAGPRIKWRIGMWYSGAVAAACIAMIALHSQDPRKWNQSGPKEGEKYFFPALSRTATGNFIPADTLMMDDYCKKCHEDAYKGWFHSSHRFSSFNNPAYLAAVRETRDFSMKKQGDVKRARWCAGCHDQVPFLSGAFDDPKFDDVNHPTAQAGITCTVCHAIVNVNSTRGNGDYTIDEPIHYPFAKSDSPLLQWVNETLVKAKPQFHKQTFLKPLHKSAEFCSTCHKVHLPPELNDYKWLRGQNHYDTYFISGASGHGARSFYYPPKAQTNCAGCHMPLQASADFGARFNETDEKKPTYDKFSIHNHLFPAANTGVAAMRGQPDIVKAHEEFHKGNTRVDIFGLREGDQIDGPLTAPLRPQVPALKPGKTYLLETVVRTLKIGHPFSQGTVDSNEIWLDVTVTSGGKIIGRSGGMDAKKEVDPYSHFINVFMLDRNGNRISRRNPQDIFVPLYNHQIPPGAAASVHYELALPVSVNEPVTVEVKLQYRKFDQQYMQFVASTARPGDKPFKGVEKDAQGNYINLLPVTTLAADRMTFPIQGSAVVVENEKVNIPVWQRWNDYGIGLLLKGKAQMRQAGEAFAEVEKLGRYDGPLNLARVHYNEGELDRAVDAINRALTHKNPPDDPPPPAWTVGWLTGLINRQQGNFEAAEKNFRSVLEDRTQEMIDRSFDFSKDYEVINELGMTLFELSKQRRDASQQAERDKYLRMAIEQFEKTLALDSENLTAHYNLQLIHGTLGDTKKSAEHAALHARYKTDDNAQDKAIAAARIKYPAGNLSVEPTVVYKLRRAGAPQLPAEVGLTNTTSGDRTETPVSSTKGGDQ